MSRILIYSHDTYGLGNIRRMLALAGDMAGTISDASILLVSGSPMLHGFRVAPGVDYVKLPSVTRTVRDGYSTRSLAMDTDDVFELRANLALASIADFRPDVILVDKKPYGVRNELEGALYYAKTHLPATSLVLVLRDILDAPEATISAWHSGGYTAAIERLYDRVLVLGTPDVFDMRREYALPPSVCAKLRFCGYIRRSPGRQSRADLRSQHGIAADDRLVLVTPGGGEDGARIVRTFADAMPIIHQDARAHSLVVTGPEMPGRHRRAVTRAVASVPRASVLEFTDDMMGWMDASDLVVCMGGYNTLCEVATLRKRAIVVPRVCPVQEQLIRAERLARAGVVTFIHPDRLTSHTLAAAVATELSPAAPPRMRSLDLSALPRVTRYVRSLLQRRRDATAARTAATAAVMPAGTPIQRIA